jgi:hypothetical protein
MTRLVALPAALALWAVPAGLASRAFLLSGWGFDPLDGGHWTYMGELAAAWWRTGSDGVAPSFLAVLGGLAAGYAAGLAGAVLLAWRRPGFLLAPFRLLVLAPFRLLGGLLGRGRRARRERVPETGPDDAGSMAAVVPDEDGDERDFQEADFRNEVEPDGEEASEGDGDELVIGAVSSPEPAAEEEALPRAPDVRPAWDDLRADIMIWLRRHGWEVWADFAVDADGGERPFDGDRFDADPVARVPAIALSGLEIALIEIVDLAGRCWTAPLWDPEGLGMPEWTAEGGEAAIPCPVASALRARRRLFDHHGPLLEACGYGPGSIVSLVAIGGGGTVENLDAWRESLADTEVLFVLLDGDAAELGAVLGEPGPEEPGVPADLALQLKRESGRILRGRR